MMSQPVLVDKTGALAAPRPAKSFGPTADRAPHTPQKGRGFTLIEMMVAVVVLGAVTTIAFPLMSSGIMRQSVRSAADAIRVMHGRARDHASQRSQPTVIDLKGGIVAIRSINPLTGAPDTLGAVQSMPDRFGVTVSATRDSLVFDGRGIGMEGSATRIYLSRGTYADTIEISALGRIR